MTMSPVSERTAAKLQELSNLVRGDQYDPARDRKLFGDFTDDLVRTVTSQSSTAQQVEEAIAEAASMSQQDPEAEFSKIRASGKAATVQSLSKVIRWAEDTRNVTLGPTQFVAVRIFNKTYIPDTSHVDVDKNAPELVNAGPLTDAELGFFENPPAMTSLARYEEERSNRTPSKDNVPDTYPPLTWDDIGRNANINEVFTAIKFFLGSREISEGNKNYSKKVKEPPLKNYLLELDAQAPKDSEDKSTEPKAKQTPDNVQKVRNLIFRLLGHVRDEKYKAWDEARKKMLAGEKLTPEEEKISRFWGSSYSEDSPESRALGRKKAQLEKTVGDLLGKHTVQTNAILGDHKIIAQRAGELRESLSSLVTYLKQMNAPGTDTVKRDGVSVEIPKTTDLRTDLSKLKEFLDKGGYKTIFETYNEMLKNMTHTLASANLSEDQKEALYWIFPNYTRGEQSMKLVSSWVNELDERQNESNKEVQTLEGKLAKTTDNKDELQSKINQAEAKQKEATEFYRQAKTMSDVLAPQVLRYMRTPLSLHTENTSDKEFNEALTKVYDTLLERHSSKYGEENVRRVLELVKSHILAKHEADKLMAQVRASNAGKLLLDLDWAKGNEAATKSAFEGAKSLVNSKTVEDPKKPGVTTTVYELKDPVVKQVYETSEDLMKWVFNTLDESVKSLGFEEITELVGRLDAVRKNLIKLSRTDKTATHWDHGVSWMYRDRSKPSAASVGQAMGDEKKKSSLGEDPTEWMRNLQADSTLAFLRKKSEELSKEGEGRPEEVEGPSFSQIPMIVGHLEDLIKTIKQYDPGVMHGKLIQNALSKADLGTKMRALETKTKARTEKKEREKAYGEKGITSIEPKKPKKEKPEATPAEPTVKTAGLVDLVRKFMAKMAAVRAATSDFLTRTAAKSKYPTTQFHTKRETKAGPVYLDAFFVNPDGVDEFVSAMQRGGFDFVNSLAIQSQSQTPEEVKQTRELSPEAPDAKQPARGYKFDVNNAVTTTMLKGSQSLQDHILKNADRMGFYLGERMRRIDDELPEVENKLESYRTSASSQELEQQHAFLKELAAFLLNPREKVKEAVPHAFPEKASKERHRTLKKMQEQVAKILERMQPARVVNGEKQPSRMSEFVARRKDLLSKYQRTGVDPETKEDYRYVDEAIRDVEYITQFISFDELQELHDDLPKYDKLNDILRSIKQKADKKGELDDNDKQKMQDIQKRVDRMNAYMAKKGEFKKMQKLYPPSSTDYADPETEKLYEKVKAVPEEERRDVREKHEQRSKELAEVETWDEFKGWIRKIQKPKFKETTAEAATEAAQAKAYLSLVFKRLAAAEANLKAAKSDEDKAKASKDVERLKGDVTKAQKDVQTADSKLAKMHARKTELGDVHPGEHTPHEARRLWKDFMADISVVLSGKGKATPKMLVDLAAESVLTHVETDTFIAGLKTIERRLSAASADEHPVLKELFGPQGDWDKTKSSVETRLDSMKSGAEELKKVLEEAKKKAASLPPAAATEGGQTEKEVADAEIQKFEVSLSNLLSNQKALQGLVDEIDTMYEKQKGISQKSIPDVSRKVEELLANPLPKVTMTNEQLKSQIEQFATKDDIEGAVSLDTDAQVSNRKVNTEISNLADLARTVNSLYGDSPNRKEMLDKLDARKKALTGLLLPSSQEKAYTDKSLEIAKANGSVTDAAQEKAYLDELSKKWLSVARWSHGGEKEKKDSDKSEHGKIPYESYIKAYPPIFGGKAGVTNKLAPTVNKIKSMYPVNTPATAENLQSMYDEVEPFVAKTKALEATVKKAVDLVLNKNVVVYDDQRNDLAMHVIGVLSSLDLYVDTVLEMLSFVKSSHIKSKLNIDTLKDEIDKNTSVLLSTSNYVSGSKKVIDDYRRNIVKVTPKATPVSPKDTDPFWSAEKREDKGTQRKKDFPLQKSVDPSWGAKKPVDESIPESGTVKTAASDEEPDDQGNIENWLKSAPRKYLEELPRIGVDDWDLIESLYGEKKAEYRDLVRGNQMIVDGPTAKERVKKMMQEAERLSGELARIEALRDLTVSIGGKMVKVSEAGSMYNRELSKYLVKKNHDQILLKDTIARHERLTHEKESYKDLLEEKEDPSMQTEKYKKKYEMKKDLSPRETQAIADQFYRSLYWYLQEYWSNKPGKEAVFGSRESPEFSKMYDAMTTFAGVRSNPTIQKVIRAGNEARRFLRKVDEGIKKTETGFKRLLEPNEKVEDVLSEISERYGFADRRITGYEDLAKENARIRRSIPSEGRYVSGVQLYFLRKYREQLVRQMESKNAMYSILREVVPAEYKVQVLEGIKSNTTDDALKADIDKRIKILRDDATAVAGKKVDQAEEEAKKIVVEGIKALDDIESLKGAVDLSNEKVPTEEKQASYRNHPGFDANIFYGSVMQSKIAEMAARVLRSRGA